MLSHQEALDALEAAKRDLDAWKTAHRRLAEMLGATDRGRDHCDAVLAVTALKQAFNVVDVRVLYDATEVHILTPERSYRIPTNGMEG